MKTVDDWTSAPPETVGLESSVLCAVADWLDDLHQSNIHSILVARQGALVFEHYRNGPDERWRRPLPEAAHGADVRHDIRSVTKSVVGLLVGVALAQQLIGSLDQPVFDYFPEYADLRTPGKGRILLRHLLTMTAGLEWDENLPDNDPRNGELRMWRAPDRLRMALEPRLVAAPGREWNYSGGCTELLGAVLAKAAGRPLDEYAREALFDPLGVLDAEWARHADGSPSASGGLRLRSRDLAKIGQLVAGRGRWKERPVLPARWVDESTSPHIGAPDRLYFYGYHWWLGRSLIGARELTWSAGIGLGGQRLFIVPALELVVVVTAGHYADAMQVWLPLAILNRFVLPAVKS